MKISINYIEDVYHQIIHSSIKMKPIDRFIKNIDNIKYVRSSDELDMIFLYKVKRRVLKDATISIGNVRSIILGFKDGKKIIDGEMVFEAQNNTNIAE